MCFPRDERSTSDGVDHDRSAQRATFSVRHAPTWPRDRRVRQIAIDGERPLIRVAKSRYAEDRALSQFTAVKQLTRGPRAPISTTGRPSGAHRSRTRVHCTWWVRVRGDAGATRRRLVASAVRPHEHSRACTTSSGGRPDTQAYSTARKDPSASTRPQASRRPPHQGDSRSTASRPPRASASWSPPPERDTRVRRRRVAARPFVRPSDQF